jgi:hypothetical protein
VIGPFNGPLTLLFRPGGPGYCGRQSMHSRSTVPAPFEAR